MKRMKQFTSRMLAVMLAGTVAIGSVSVTAFGAEDVGSTVAAAEEFSVEEGTEEGVVEPSSAETVDEEMMTESSSAEVVDEEGVSESPDAAFADTSEMAAEETAVTYYTVTLDANGGYFANEWDDVLNETLEKTEVLNKIVPVGGMVSVVPVKEQEGNVATFLGWSLERDGEILPQEQEGYAPIGDCVLYALWKYDDAADPSVAIGEDEPEEVVNNPIETENPEASTPEGGVDQENNNEDVLIDETVAEENAEEAPASYAVTLDANGGYFINEWDDVLGEYVEHAEILNKVIPVEGIVTVVPVNEQDGITATFLGWSLERDGEILPQEQEGYAPIGDCVLYAVWRTDTPAGINENEINSEIQHQDEVVEESDGNAVGESFQASLEGNELYNSDEKDYDDIHYNTDIKGGFTEENEVHNNQTKEKECIAIDTSEIIVSEEEEEVIVSNCLFSSVNTPSDGNRYTVLLIDNSGSMSNNSRLKIAKESAVRFCEQMLAAEGVNYISVVGFESSVRCAYDFTNQMDVLKSEISNMSADGGTNTNAALNQAKTLLTSVPSNSNKNIVLLSDGIPESGDVSETGRYSKDDHNTSYKYGNVIYSTAKSMDDSWNIYTLGFFQGVEGSDLSFGQKLLHDIQNHGYYDVQNADELEVVFDEISSGILENLTILGPLSAEDGDDITIIATFKSEGSVPGLSNIEWSCEPEYLSFDNIRLEGPDNTGEENLWRICVDADVVFPDTVGKKMGSKTADISVSVGQYKVKKDFTVKAQTVFKAEKNGFPVCNDNEGFGYPSEYHFPIERYVQAMGGNIISDVLNIGSVAAHIYENEYKGHVWGGNCFGLSVLAAAEYEGKIDLKHTYFSNNRGGVLSKFGYQEKSSSRYMFKKDSEFVKFVEKVQIAAQGCAQIKNCSVLKKDENYSQLISELKSGKGKPYVVAISGHHAVVIDPSKPVIECDNGETMIHIYDPNMPCTGYELDHPFSYYISNPNSDRREDVPLLVVSNSGSAKISYPGKTYTWYMYEGTTRDQVKFYDISKLDSNFFTGGGTYIGFTRGNIITDSMDLTWDTDNKLTINGLKVFSSNNNSNFGAFIYDSTEIQDQSSSPDSGMYYFDADATLIDYESSMAAVTLINDYYPAMYMITNEGLAKISVDLENHSVQVISLEDGAKIVLASTIDDAGEDAYNLDFTLKKDQKLTMIRDGENIILRNNTVDNTETSTPITVTINYFNNERSDLDSIVISDSSTISFDRSAVKYDVIDGSCGEEAFWRISQTGTLTIYGNGVINSFKPENSKNTAPWKDYVSDINRIVIGDGITEIGEGAFYSTSVKNIEFGSGIQTIRKFAFKNCTNLTDIIFPNSLTTIEESAFNSCTSLGNIQLQMGLKYLSGFDNCKSLESITVPETVTTIGFFAFSNCSSLENIELPKKLKEIQSNAFSGCINLKEIKIPSSVTSIGNNVIERCEKITSIVFPPYATCDIGSYAFSGCVSLERISIPDTVTSLGTYAFYKCSNLKSIVLPSKVSEIGDHAFVDCASLTSISIPVSVKIIGKQLFRVWTTDSSAIKKIYYEGTEHQWDNISFADKTLNNIEKCYGSYADIKNAVVSGVVGKSYTGSSIYQDPVIKDSDVILVEGIDYVVWYKDNIDAGSATMIISGLGNYSGIKEINFNIRKKSISGASVSKIIDKDYNGKEISQKPVVEISGIVLQDGVDYELSYNENINVGEACMIITGKGNYQGTKMVYFAINPLSIDNASILGIAGKQYTGEKIAQMPIVKVFNQRLTKDIDYDLVYNNNIEVGTSSITVRGKGNYVGEKTAVFIISSCKLLNSVIKGISSKTYTGKAITQTPIIKIGSSTLNLNKDYTVSYKNNINVGTATVTITGKGNYTGTKTATFKINKASQSITAKAAASRIAAGKTTTVSITGNKGDKSFKSSDATIATVDSKSGKVTAKRVGTVKITATSAATANYNAASKTVTIKVVPAATASLKADNQATGIKLTWKKVTGANGYKIYRGSTLIKTITSGSTVTFADTKANTNGTKYTYKVVAKATTGDSTLSKSIAVYRVTRPALSSVTNSAASKMTVKWGKNVKATGYQIQYSTDKTFKTGNKAITVAGASAVSKVIGSLTKSKTYYVRIRTYKTVGSAKYWSVWSAAKSVKIAK